MWRDGGDKEPYSEIVDFLYRRPRPSYERIFFVWPYKRARVTVYNRYNTYIITTVRTQTWGCLLTA